MILPFSLPCSFSSLKHPSTPYSSPGMFWFCYCIAISEKPLESHSGQLDLACGPPVLWAAAHTLPPTSFSTTPSIQLQLSLKCNHQTLDPAPGALGPRMTVKAVTASVDLDMHCASWVPAPRSHPAGCLPLPALSAHQAGTGLASSSHQSHLCICSPRRPPPPWPDLRTP